MPREGELTREALARVRREPDWLSVACGLSADTLGPLLPFYLPLAERIAQRHAQKGSALIVGIQGPQAAGKTTLTHLLQRVLNDVCDLVVASLSIDDLYLTRSERAELAQRVHPLFMTRGVPGTHDVGLGVRVMRALTQPGLTAIPRFDKAEDDRMPESAWPLMEGPCDVVLFEGLWIGVPALDQALLEKPINALEAREDAQGIWRRHANRELAERYPALFAPCELLVHLQVPDFACVKRWRAEAEHALRARLAASGTGSSRTMDAAALARFFDHYERFTAHAMEQMPKLADVVLRLDRDHRLVGSTLMSRAAP